jgi:hypothetical protein
MLLRECYRNESNRSVLNAWFRMFMHSFSNILFKHPVSLMYLLVYIHFRLICNILSCPTSLSLHVPAVYGHRQGHVYPVKIDISMSCVNNSRKYNGKQVSKLIKLTTKIL